MRESKDRLGLLDVLEALKPEQVVEIRCMQERVYGDAGLPPPGPAGSGQGEPP